MELAWAKFPQNPAAGFCFSQADASKTSEAVGSSRGYFADRCSKGDGLLVGIGVGIWRPDDMALWKDGLASIWT